MSVRADIIKNLFDEIQDIKIDTDIYDVNIVKITDYEENILNKIDSQTPMIMIIDEGNEERSWMETGYEAFAFNLQIIVYIRKNETIANLKERLNDILAAIKNWIYRAPDLGDNVYEIQYAGGIPIQFSADNMRALAGVRARILYWTAQGSY